jgi:hypothetical protein
MAKDTRQAEGKPEPAQGCSAPSPYLGLGVAVLLVALAAATRWLVGR